MRPDTLEQIRSAVGYLENSFMNPMGDEDTAPISLDVAIKYCYSYFVEDSTTTYGFSSAVRFDGKRNIIAEMTKQIKENPHIVLKEEK